MRQGVPLAGNHLMTELALVTGAVEVVVVDYQCIMPSLVTVAGCYHSRIVTTSPKAKFTGATHIEFDVHNARQKAVEVVELAIERFKVRDAGRVEIPVEPVEVMTGFSNEAVLAALGGTAAPLIEAASAPSPKASLSDTSSVSPPVNRLMTAISRSPMRPSIHRPFRISTAPT